MLKKILCVAIFGFVFSVLFFAVFLFPFRAMASGTIVRDTFYPITTKTGTTFNQSFVIAGTGEILIVWTEEPTLRVTSVTYNGDALSVYSSQTYQSGRYLRGWYLLNPDSGEHDISVSTSVSGVYFSAVAYKNVSAVSSHTEVYYSYPPTQLNLVATSTISSLPSGVSGYQYCDSGYSTTTATTMVDNDSSTSGLCLIEGVPLSVGDIVLGVTYSSGTHGNHPISLITFGQISSAPSACLVSGSSVLASSTFPCIIPNMTVSEFAPIFILSIAFLLFVFSFAYFRK